MNIVNILVYSLLILPLELYNLIWRFISPDTEKYMFNMYTNVTALEHYINLYGGILLNML